jgi:hypothetical protein
MELAFTELIVIFLNNAASPDTVSVDKPVTISSDVLIEYENIVDTLILDTKIEDTPKTEGIDDRYPRVPKPCTVDVS